MTKKSQGQNHCQAFDEKVGNQLRIMGSVPNYKAIQISIFKVQIHIRSIYRKDEAWLTLHKAMILLC